MNLSRLAGLSVLVLISLVTEAAPKPFVDNFEVASQLSYQLVDERPASERTASKGSSNRQACDFGVWTIGEEDVVPSRIDYLKSRLQREVKPGLLSGAVVKVKEFSIYFNYQLPARSALKGITVLPPVHEGLEEALKGLLQSFECWAVPGKPGGYDLSTNPGTKPAGVVTIRLEIGDQPFESRYVFIPTKEDQHLPVGGTAVIRSVDRVIEVVNRGK